MGNSRTRYRQPRPSLKSDPDAGRVTVTRADGTVFTVGPYNPDQLKVVRAGGKPRQPQTTSRLRTRIYRRDGGVCQRCGKDCSDIAWEIDHVIPKKLAGRTEWDNLQLLCRVCNKAKGASLEEASG